MIGEVTEDQSESLGFLALPAAYGSDEPVTRIDTHASHVFLAGDRVYKMKRALRYPYLDYGTIERRRWACEREISLNRRTAPTLYLGLAALRRGAGGRLYLDRQGGAGVRPSSGWSSCGGSAPMRCWITAPRAACFRPT